MRTKAGVELLLAGIGAISRDNVRQVLSFAGCLFFSLERQICDMSLRPGIQLLNMCGTVFPQHGSEQAQIPFDWNAPCRTHEASDVQAHVKTNNTS